MVYQQRKWSKPVLAIIFLAFFLAFELALFYKIVLLFKIDHIWFVSFYIAITTLFLFSRPILALFYRDDHSCLARKNYVYHSVSCVIPVKNEEQAIYKTVASCLVSDYPGDLECIVIDDGSTDDTLSEINRAKRDFRDLSASRSIKLIIFDENRGKRHAIAAGVREAANDLIVFVDSDSFLGANSIKLISEHFSEDPKIGAVSGNTKVENAEVNMLTKMQSARYGISFDVFKSCEAVNHSVNCCPGCFSVYRARALKDIVDEWENHRLFGQLGTFGDDRSLTNFILKNGWRIFYCRSAYASTIVPHTLGKYSIQQLRWKKSWIREGLFGAATFMWRRHPIASLSFYINLILPILAPFVVLYSFVWSALNGRIDLALLFLASIVLTSTVFGLYDYMQSRNRYWYYAIPFGIFYALVLVWQMPVALLRFTDRRWGTR